MARKDIVDRIGRLARAVASAERKGDDPGIEKWAVRLADASTSLAVLVNPALAEEDDEPFFDADLFEAFEDDSVTYLFGGGMGNPNGVSFTYGQAKAWWAYVFAANLNLSAVRSTLLPGGLVLSPLGKKAAFALAKSTVYAPEDFNPLGLEVIA